MSSVRPGDVLAGKYRVERVLGSGGMGYVVAARHLQLEQLVAMKFLRQGGQGTVDRTEASGRFLREAKAVVRLRNEHVARVFDVGTLESGEPYIVMEYLDGADLSAIAKQRGALPVPEAVEYILQACEALGEAHSLGIVHRDVKLANLFVARGPTGSPVVKVLDFGISKMNPFGDGEHDMTRTSAMLGSPRFMSPEQMNDPRTVDARSDIWSLGVVLYRLISGRAPFEADVLGRLLTMVMHEAQPPLSNLVALPPGLERVVDTCLQKDRQFRFANIAEFAYALAPYAFDVARAHATAERIAAMLSVPQPTGAIPLSDVPPYSMNAPGGMDSVTAAPWTGTHGGGASAPSTSRSSAVWTAMALVMLLVLCGGFAKFRSDRARAASHGGDQNTGSIEGSLPSSPVEAPTATQANTPSVVGDPAPTTPSVTSPPPVVTVGNGGSKTAPAGRASAFVVPPSRKATRNGANGSNGASAPVNPPAGGGAPEDGIPSTRD